MHNYQHYLYMYIIKKCNCTLYMLNNKYDLKVIKKIHKMMGKKDNEHVVYYVFY